MSTPFVLMIARPDYKRPYSEQILGKNLEEAKLCLYSKFYDYLYNSINDEEITFKNYIDNYYNYGYMYQDPYTLKVYDLEENKWIDRIDIVKETFNLALEDCMVDIEEECSEEENIEEE